MSYEESLEQMYPIIAWREPIPLKVFGGRDGFGCRFCIAISGYAPAKKQMPGFSEIKDDVLSHIKKEHIHDHAG